jgi:hypothetical protein
MSRIPGAIALVPLAVAAALSVAACTATPSAAPTPPADAAPAPAPTGAVGWIDRFCGVLVPLLDESEPVPVDLTDPQQALADATRSLDALNAAVGTAIEGLDQLGPAPTPSEDALVSGIRPVLTSVRSAAGDARSAIDAGGGATFAVGTRNGLAESVRQSSPAPDIAADPELGAAAAAAGSCRRAGLAPPS